MFENFVMNYGVKRVDVGGKLLTNYMKELVTHRCAACALGLPCRLRLLARTRAPCCCARELRAKHKSGWLVVVTKDSELRVARFSLSFRAFVLWDAMQ